jgi:hypothetical protein
MQIHEITKRPLKEGLLGDLGRGLASGMTGFDIPRSQTSIDRDAAASAAKLQAQGAGEPRAVPTVQDAVASVQKNTAQQQYIKGLVAQWQQKSKELKPSTPQIQPQSTVATAAATPTPSTPSTSGTAMVRPTYGKPGAPTVSFAGQRGQRPLDPKNPSDAKILAQLQSQGKLNEAPQEYTTPGGIVVPGGTKTDRTTARTPAPSAPVSGQYQDTFEKWAAEKLQTNIPRVGTVTLDDIKKTDIKDELDRALAQVVATAGNAQKNAVAVNNYLTIAVAGVARKSQQLRQDNNKGGGGGAGGSMLGGAITTQQELNDKLKDEVKINAGQIEALKKILQNPADRQALFKAVGVR